MCSTTTGQEMTQTVMRKIKRQFASLQVEVRSAMEARQVKVNDVHQFLVSFFQSECCIPEAPDLTKLFNIITEHKIAACKLKSRMDSYLLPILAFWRACMESG